MQDGSGAADLQQLLRGSWIGLVYDDPKVAVLMKTRPGEYLSGRPTLALAALLFSVTAALPVGIFLTFALVTVVVSALVAAFFAAFLLLGGGLFLLCSLGGLAAFSLLASAVCNLVYVAASNVLNLYHPHLRKGGKVHRKANGCDASPAKETQKPVSSPTVHQLLGCRDACWRLDTQTGCYSNETPHPATACLNIRHE